MSQPINGTYGSGIATEATAKASKPLAAAISAVRRGEIPDGSDATFGRIAGHPLSDQLFSE
ncbi:hypothetical protein ACQP2T_03160 [Nonomuraea sp. CA-143628]|uniref:hypothetical protein n=1 Tax=Nonomuraea sp. CA-143628 TaxID=3239997 RepID=UPI003D90E6B5